MRERGLPQTPLYIMAQDERRQFLDDRRNRINAERNQRLADQLGSLRHQMRANAYRAQIQDPARREMPRAEPDQVVRSAVRDDQGRILGRYAGAITAGMTNKTDVLGMRSMMPNAPTNEGSTYQMDLMDMSTRGGATGFGLLAVDVNSRYLYGELVRDKTLPGLIAAFSRLLQNMERWIPTRREICLAPLPRLIPTMRGPGRRRSGRLRWPAEVFSTASRLTDTAPTV